MLPEKQKPCTVRQGKVLGKVYWPKKIHPSKRPGGAGDTNPGPLRQDHAEKEACKLSQPFAVLRVFKLGRVEIVSTEHCDD